MNSIFFNVQTGHLVLSAIALIFCGVLICLMIWKNTPEERKGEALFLICLATITVFGNIIYLAT